MILEMKQKLIIARLSAHDKICSLCKNLRPHESKQIKTLNHSR